MPQKSVDPIAHRRDPTQRRAHVLVDAIRQAAVEIIEKEGPAALTTNRVADRAGVSIGSLYHYYPNKESIIADLFEMRVQALMAEIDLMRERVRFQELPLAGALESYLRLALSHRSRLAHIHREFLRDFGARFEVPARMAPDGRTYHEITVQWLRELLERHRDEIDVPDPTVAAQMLIVLSEGLARAAAEERLPVLPPEQLAADVTRAMLGYLRYRPQ
jgi:AcrR family transcriptional regulator